MFKDTWVALLEKSLLIVPLTLTILVVSGHQTGKVLSDMTITIHLQTIPKDIRHNLLFGRD